METNTVKEKHDTLSASNNTLDHTSHDIKDQMDLSSSAKTTLKNLGRVLTIMLMHNML